MSVMNKRCERDFLLECIEVYKTLPVLWDTNLREYNDRTLKNEAYKILVEKFREKYPDANRSDVRRKINTLRTNYRKELRRLFFKEAEGKPEKRSRLWYFSEMEFLGQHIGNQIQKSDAVDDSDAFYNNMELDMNSSQYSDCDIFDREQITSVKMAHEQFDTDADNIENTSTTYKRDPRDNVYQLIEMSESEESAEFEHLANVWTADLKKLKPDQQLHAKKIIRDVLYEGQLGNLYKDCVQFLPPPPIEETNAQM